MRSRVDEYFVRIGLFRQPLSLGVGPVYSYPLKYLTFDARPRNLSSDHFCPLPGLIPRGYFVCEPPAQLS